MSCSWPPSLLIWFGVPNAAMIYSRETPTFSRLGSSCTDESFMVAFCSNAVGLRRCVGSKRDEDESVPCDCIDCILDAKHPVNAIIGSTSNILIEPESPFNRGFPPRTLFIILWGPTFSFFLPFRERPFGLVEHSES